MTQPPAPSSPFRLDRPARQSVPFVFASPHSGRAYPRELLALTRLDSVTLRRSEDAFVDELFAGMAALGAPLLSAQFPRALIDVNRGMAELDRAMFEGALNMKVDTPSPRVAAGLGVIPRIVRDGAEIYSRKLDSAEVHTRLEQLYKPYHAALAGLMDETHARFGVAVLIDCHSMPSALAVPDIVLGDRYGASAAPALSRGLSSYLGDARLVLADLPADDPQRRRQLVDEVIEQNRMYARAAQAQGDERLARVLRAFEPVLLALAEPPTAADGDLGARSQIDFELGILQTKLNRSPSKIVQSL